MKKSLSSVISLSLLASGVFATSAIATTASAEVAFNAGVMSQYIFRGAVQRDSTSLMGGADYTHESGLYAGTWLAQVGTENNATSTLRTSTNDGLEVDFYGGIKKEFSGALLGAGFTSYQYTNKIDKSGKGFDTSYNELNLSLGYGPVTFTVNPGYREGSSGLGTKDQNYIFSSVKAEYSGFYGLVGYWDWDFKGSTSTEKPNGDGVYQQVGYKTSLGGIDLDAAVVHSSKNLNTVGKDALKDDNTTMMISATKAF